MWFSNRFMTLLSKTLNSIQPSNENQFKSQQDIIIGIIGSTNVGKTTFIHNGLDTVISYPVTSSVRQHSSSISINNKQQSILILETNNLKDLTTLVHAVFICYDITQQSSIDMVPDILKYFRSQNIPTYLFGLKEDLSLLRQVDTTIGDQLSKSFNIPFYELNAFNSHHIYHLLKSILTKTHSKEPSNVSLFLPPPPLPNQPLTTNDSSIKNDNSNNNKNHYRISSTISNNSILNQQQYGFVYAPTSSDYPLSSIQPSVYDSSISPSQILFLQKRRGSKDSCESSSTGLTVDSIIDRLIGYDNMNEDDHIIPVFIIFFRKFMKPSELVNILIERFEQDISIPILPTPIQKRIVSILTTWVSEYWSDFTNKKTRHYLHQFVKRSQQIESMKSILEVLQSLINQPPPYYDPDYSWGQTDNDNNNTTTTVITTTTTKKLEDKLQQQKDNEYLTYFDFQPDFMSKYLDEQTLSHPSTTTTTAIDPSVRSFLSSSSYPMHSYITRDSTIPYHQNNRLSLLSSSSSSSSSAIPGGSGGYSLSSSIPPYSSSSEMTTISDSIYGFPSPPSQSSLRSIKQQQQQQVSPPACKSSPSSQHKLSLRQTKSMQMNSSLSSSSSSSYKRKSSNNNNYNNKITQQPKYGGGLLLLNFSFNTSNVHFCENNNNNNNKNNNNSLYSSIPTNDRSHLTATTASIVASSTTSLSTLSTSSDISSSCISSSSLTSSASSSLSIANNNTNNNHICSSKINSRLSASFPASITSHFKPLSLSSSSSSTSLTKNNNNNNNNNNNHPLFLSSTSIATSTTSSSTIGLNNKNKKQQQMRKKKNKQQSKKNLIPKWLSLESIRPSSSFTTAPLSSSSSLNHPFKKSIKKDTKIFLSIPSQYMAEQLTWIEAELFGQIKSREFIRMIWAYSTDQTKKQQQQQQQLSSSPLLPSMATPAMLIDNDTNLDHHQNKNHPLYTNALQASISHFNFISAWVISMIVLQPKLKKRIALLEKFMVIAVALRNQNNYNTLMAILAGINNTSVLRLRQTQQHIVKKKIYKKFQSLEKLMSSHRSYCSYRLALKQSSSPCIPYLGIHNQDLIALAEANKDMKSDGTIHWEKFKLMGDCIVAIVKYQKQKHNYTPNIMIQKWLSRTVILSDEVTKK
ncbi:unnamed protein product [Cunninghamella echinulata]